MASEGDHAPHVYLLGKTALANEHREFHVRDDPIVHLAAGDEHGIVITQRGRAFAFGANSFGQLGLGHDKSIQRVACIKSLKFGETGEKLILAACGVGCSLVATNRGSLYGFGCNTRCQLGLPFTDEVQSYSEPKRITELPSKISWKQMAMGSEHACALTESGQVYTWGANDEGQCGFDREIDPIPTPQRLELDFEVIAIACGNYHTALIRRDGRLFLFGANESRQLGLSVAPSFIGPTEASLPGRVKSVACGNQHTLVLTDQGKVYVTGVGNRGQLGLGLKIQSVETFEQLEILPKNIVRIAAGEAHSAVIDDRGRLYVFGDGKHGKLGFNTHANEFQPRLVNTFQELSVSQVLCGGCQTIVLAKKRVDADQNESPAEEDNEISEALTLNPLTLSLARTKRHELLNNRTNQPPLATLRHSTPRDSLTSTTNRHFQTEPSSDPEPDDIASNPDLSESMRSQLYNSRFGMIEGEFQTLDSNLHRDTLGRTGTRVKMLKTGALDQTAPLEAKDQQRREPPPRPAPRRNRSPEVSEDSDEEAERQSASPVAAKDQPQPRTPAPRALPKQSPRQASDSESIDSAGQLAVARARARLSSEPESGKEEEEEDNQRRTPVRKSRSPKASPSRSSTTSSSSSPPRRPSNAPATRRNPASTANESSPGFFSRIFSSNPSTNAPRNADNATSSACSIM